jgi:hypothetical protein
MLTIKLFLQCILAERCVARMPRRKATTYSMLDHNCRTSLAPPPSEPRPELKQEPDPSDIFNIGLNEADIAEFVLLDA